MNIIKVGVSDEKISNLKLIIQKIQKHKKSNEISIDKFTKNKKIKYEIKKMNEIKDLEIKNDESIRGKIPIKYKKEKKIIYNGDYLSLKCCRKIINTKTKYIFRDIKNQSINTENLKEQRDLKIDKPKKLHKQKGWNNILENSIALIYYI